MINTIQENTNGYQYPLYWMYWNCLIWICGIFGWFAIGDNSTAEGYYPYYIQRIRVDIFGIYWDYMEDIGYWD